MWTRKAVYDAIDGEREYQGFRAVKDGTKTPDRAKDLESFVLYAQDYLEEARRQITREWGPDSNRAPLHTLRKVAALLVAAMETYGAPQRAGFEAGDRKFLFSNADGTWFKQNIPHQYPAATLINANREAAHANGNPRTYSYAHTNSDGTHNYHENRPAETPPVVKPPPAPAPKTPSDAIVIVLLDNVLHMTVSDAKRGDLKPALFGVCHGRELLFAYSHAEGHRYFYQEVTKKGWPRIDARRRAR